MSNQNLNGYDRPHYDTRVKKVMQIEQIYHLLGKGLAVLTLSLIFGLLFINLAKAATVPDLFYVPIVKVTGGGAAVVQPQTGAGYNTLENKKVNPGNTVVKSPIIENGQNSSTEGGVNYRPPKYDAFREGSTNLFVQIPDEVIKNVDSVDFTIKNNISGTSDRASGTTHSTFTFTANTVSKSYKPSELEYRWDFENDGKVDTYFSRISTVTHSYLTTGEFEVKLEVLDARGQVSSVIKRVLVVKNDAPSAVFTVNKLVAPKNSIFRFDTALSSDNQYARSQLNYRFDWNGDGQFDTNFQNKNIWNHLFRDIGVYRVIMEVRDPEGLSSKAEITLNIVDDLPPVARMSLERLSDFRYSFDASESTDDHTESRKLRYRWDFNYSGPDDIVFDSSWSNSPKFTGNYRLAGSKKIRLQVMDEQGLVDETFAQIEVPWAENFVNIAVEMI